MFAFLMAFTVPEGITVGLLIAILIITIRKTR